MHAISGYGLDALSTDPWLPAPPETALVTGAFSRQAPTLVTDAQRQAPELFARLGYRSVLLAPLAHGAERLGLLAIALQQPPTGGDLTGDLSQTGDGFVAALELFRLRQNDALQREIRRLLEEFAAILGTTLNLNEALHAFCRGTNRLFGADRTSVWVYERRDREFILRASSQLDQLVSNAHIPAYDSRSPVALALGRTHAEIHLEDGLTTATVTVPLRGCRRALGTLILEGVRVEAGSEFTLLDRADELGRQLSAAVENIQLLDDVVRSRRELENTFDSIAHLIVVWDRRGRIVHANEAFMNRIATARDKLLDRPIRDCLGPELGVWLAAQGGRGPRNADDPPATIELFDPVLNGPFLVTVTDLRDREMARVGSVLVAEDLTSQIRLQAEREELRKRLTQSEKLAALGQFVAGIAHELNNPLQGVLGHLELLRVTGAIPKPLRREVQTIYREADRAAKIVRNLLVFSGSRRSRVDRSASMRCCRRWSRFGPRPAVPLESKSCDTCGQAAACRAIRCCSTRCSSTS